MATHTPSHEATTSGGLAPSGARQEGDNASGILGKPKTRSHKLVGTWPISVCSQPLQTKAAASWESLFWPECSNSFLQVSPSRPCRPIADGVLEPTFNSPRVWPEWASYALYLVLSNVVSKLDAQDRRKSGRWFRPWQGNEQVHMMRQYPDWSLRE